MTPELADAERAKGYTFACTLCKHLWRARSHGHAEGCTAPGRCSDVTEGLTYPHYQGPLDLARQCYVCGADNAYVVALAGDQERGLGACAAHAKTLSEAQPLAPRLMVLQHGGILLPAERLTRKWRKGFFEMIAEIEREFEREEAARGPAP